VNNIDKYGRNCYDQIKAEIDGKSLEEIKDYCKAFWERINDLPEGGKILRNMYGIFNLGNLLGYFCI
jgi:hypothetical protein